MPNLTFVVIPPTHLSLLSTFIIAFSYGILISKFYFQRVFLLVIHY